MVFMAFCPVVKLDSVERSKVKGCIAAASMIPGNRSTRFA